MLGSKNGSCSETRHCCCSKSSHCSHRAQDNFRFQNQDTMVQGKAVILLNTNTLCFVAAVQDQDISDAEHLNSVFICNTKRSSHSRHYVCINTSASFTRHCSSSRATRCSCSKQKLVMSKKKSHLRDRFLSPNHGYWGPCS